MRASPTVQASGGAACGFRVLHHRRWGSSRQRYKGAHKCGQYVPPNTHTHPTDSGSCLSRSCFSLVLPHVRPRVSVWRRSPERYRCQMHLFGWCITFHNAHLPPLSPPPSSFALIPCPFRVYPQFWRTIKKKGNENALVNLKYAILGMGEPSLILSLYSRRTESSLSLFA